MSTLDDRQVSVFSPQSVDIMQRHAIKAVVVCNDTLMRRSNCRYIGDVVLVSTAAACRTTVLLLLAGLCGHAVKT